MLLTLNISYLIVGSFLNKNVSKGKLTQQEADEALSRISVTTDLNDMKNVDFVIEAVNENLDLKKTIFTQLSEIVPEDVILASNTSTLSITKIASFTKNPENVIGMHFVCILLYKSIEYILFNKIKYVN